MARSWEEVGGVALAITKGDHDVDLEYIQMACTQRLKRRFRKGQRIKLTGTGNVMLEGAVGVITQPNVKTISVQLDEHGPYKVPPRMLEVV